jgi:hypothetical protein
MSQAKQASKRKRTTKAVPVAGLAGLSLSLVGGATTAIGGPAANLPMQATVPSHEITLGEEEISDVSLATFYVFDKETAEQARPELQLVRGGCGGHGGGHGGCGGRGCGARGGCGGHGCGARGCGGRGCGLHGCGCWGGCGCGCCISWGGCGPC